MNCKTCNEEMPDYIYLEENIVEWQCFDCSLKENMKCEICNEILNINKIDKANSILDDSWIEMCDSCAEEFNEGRETYNIRRSRT